MKAFLLAFKPFLDLVNKVWDSISTRKKERRHEEQIEEHADDNLHDTRELLDARFRRQKEKRPRK